MNSLEAVNKDQQSKLGPDCASDALDVNSGLSAMNTQAFTNQTNSESNELNVNSGLLSATNTQASTNQTDCESNEFHVSGGLLSDTSTQAFTNQADSESDEFNVNQTDNSAGAGSSNDIFDGFASADEISRMSTYHKQINIARITKYFTLKANGLHIDKPFMECYSPPKTTKRKSLSSKENTDPQGSDDSPLKKRKNEDQRHGGTVSKLNKETRQVNEAEGSAKKQGKELSDKKDKKSKPSKQPILDCHEEFLNSNCLDKIQKAFIKHYLETPVNFVYNIHDILKAREDLEDEVEILVRDGVLFKKALSTVLQALVQHLYTLVRSPNLVSPDMREGLAVSIVATYPKLAQKPIKEGDKPWTWLYNRDNNTGKIANIVQNKQRQQTVKRLRGGGSEKRKRGPKSVQNIELLRSIPDSELSKQASFLRYLVDNDSNKSQIESKMRSTYDERRELVTCGKYNTNALLVAFPRLKSFKGQMIDFDFKILHEGKEHNFLMNWGGVSKKIVAIAESNTKLQSCLEFKDDALNAMIILAKYLPRPKRIYQWENKMNPDADLGDFVQLEPMGTNAQNAIETKRELAKYPVQPYLLAIGSKDKIEAWSLILGDSHSIGLPSNTEPIQALDLLMKSFYVLNVHFPLGWKHVYRFIFCHIYGIPPDNPRLSNFTEEWLAINQN